MMPPKTSATTPSNHVRELKYCRTTTLSRLKRGREVVDCFCRALPMALDVAATSVIATANQSMAAHALPTS